MGQLEESKALQYVTQKGWEFRTTEDQIILESCPVCGKPNYHFYMSFAKEKDGLWSCKVCGQEGNLYHLKTAMGDRTDNMTSMKDAAETTRQAGKLPDVDAAHRVLLLEAENSDVDEPALEYLIGRGFTMEVIEKYKLGLVKEFGKRWIVFPFFKGDNLIYAKYRSVPPDEKEFRGSSGRVCPLFNEDIVQPEMAELLFVEGEADALACLSQGIEYVVGVPGANSHKAVWIKKLDDCAPKQMYLMYDNDQVGQKAAKEMAIRIGIDKVRNILLPKEMNGTNIKDINEFFKAGGTLEQFTVLKMQSQPFNVEGVQSASEVIEELKFDIENGTLSSGQYDSPWGELNILMGKLDGGDLVGILAEAKVGKEQPLSSRILTTKGWSTMGDMKVGTQLASIDGEGSVVTGVFPQGYKPVYRIAFSDGRSTRAGEQHLWKVGSVSNFSRDGFRTVTTLGLKSLLENGSDEYFVPLFNGEFDNGSDLPIDPWLLGAIIGDGSLSSGNCSFTKADKHVVEEVRTRLSYYACELSQVDDINYNIVGVERGSNEIRSSLRDVGLLGSTSVEKSIPTEYLKASRTSRLELLQGLMDTDGSLEGAYKIPCFNTSSVKLAYQVEYLVRSLGGIAEVTPRQTSYTYRGVKRAGKLSYRILVKLKNDKSFSHSYKAVHECVRKREPRLKVVSIELSGHEQCQCIMVSHPSHLYVTDDFVVTHNTTMAMNWLQYLIQTYKQSGLMFCQEMQPKRLVRKWMSFVADTPDSEITLDTVNTALCIAADMEADYLFGYTKSTKFSEVADTIRQAVRRYGVKFVCFDNLQLLCRNIEHSAQETSVMTKQFKQLAMELNIVILLIIQPNRVREGDIVSARNASGSSAIEKDVDYMICLHRGREGKIKQDDFEAAGGFIEVAENFSPQLMARVDLSRYSSGGTTTLWMDGSKSKVTDFPKDAKAALAALGKSFNTHREVEPEYVAA